MRVPVFDRQTIGSLMIRRAWERGDSPATMTHRMGLGWSIWTRDIDRSLDECSIKQIARVIELPHDQVEAMTLTYALQSAGIPTQRNGFQRWLTPVGIYHRKRLRYGQLFCPVCLCSEQVQLHMTWRLASSWVCITHNVLLRDGCSHCGAPFAPFRHDALVLARCDQCMATLRVPLRTATETERSLQMRVWSLWQEAVQGDGTRLTAFHKALTATATQDISFRSAGEPWAYWRVAERRELLVKIAQQMLVRPLLRPLVVPAATPRNAPKKVGRQLCNKLPSDPSERAETLLQLAFRVKFARRLKARMAKTA